MSKVLYENSLEVPEIGQFKVVVNQNHMVKIQTYVPTLAKERGIQQTFSDNLTEFGQTKEKVPAVEFYWNRFAAENNRRPEEERLKQDDIRRKALEQAKADYETANNMVTTEAIMISMLEPNFTTTTVNDIYKNVVLTDNLTFTPLTPNDFENVEERQILEEAQRYVFPRKNEYSPLEQKAAWIRKYITSNAEVMKEFQPMVEEATKLLTGADESVDDSGFHS